MGLATGGARHAADESSAPQTEPSPSSRGAGLAGAEGSEWRFPARAAWAIVFLLSVAQRPAQAFRYDADSYWSGSLALFSGGSPYDLGYLGYHGALTSIVYALAALVEFLIPGSGRVAVLVENAAIIATIGAVILPWIVRGLGARRAWAGWLCAGLTWFTLARFAPYPLMDIPAAAALFGAVALLGARRRPLALATAGAAVAVSVNLRAAYLLVAIAVTLGVVALRRWQAAHYAAGAVAGLVPQMVVNLVRGSGLSFTPPEAAKLVDLQASAASYVVRYDTVLDGGPPQQFYCDPGMAAAAAAHPFDTTMGLARAMVSGLPDSLGLVIKKICAALAWPSTTPYSSPAATERHDLAVAVVLITVGGVAGLVLAARWSPSRRYAVMSCGLAVAACLSLMTSATEVRFAVPLVLIAIAGCAWAAPFLLERHASGSPRHSAEGALGPDVGDRLAVRWLLCVGAVSVLVLAGAAWGLADAMPPGPVTAAECALPH